MKTEILIGRNRLDSEYTDEFVDAPAIFVDEDNVK